MQMIVGKMTIMMMMMVMMITVMLMLNVMMVVMVMVKKQKERAMMTLRRMWPTTLEMKMTMASCWSLL